MIIRIKDWNRKHTLVSLFLFLLIGVGSYFAYDMYVAPQKAVADQAASVPLPEKPPALSPEEMAEVDAAVPRSADAPDILPDLERMAGEAGVSITSTEATDASSRGGAPGMTNFGRLQQHSITAQITGPNASSITSFLALLEQNPRYIRVDSVRIKQDSEVRLDIGLTVFSQ